MPSTCSRSIREQNRWPTLLTVTTRESGTAEHPVEQQPGQREVTEVVHAELQLEPVRGGRSRRRHHPGVVDQQIDVSVPVTQRRGGTPDRHQRGEVELLDGDVHARRRGTDVGGGRFALRDRPHREHHRRTVDGQCPRRLPSDAGVRPGDHRGPTGERRDVGGRPPWGSHGARYVPIARSATVSRSWVGGVGGRPGQASAGDAPTTPSSIARSAAPARLVTPSLV